MTPTDKESYHFGFDTIVEDAQKRVAQEGYHSPKVFIEGEKGVVETELPEFPESHEDKLAYMAALGQLIATSGRIGELLQIFVVSSGSLWEAEDSVRLEFTETAHTDAKSVLTISGVQLEERRKNLIIFEVLRGNKNQIVDFLDLLIETDIGIPLETPLEDAFITGLHDASA